jgi:hypothetical protein
MTVDITDLIYAKRMIMGRGTFSLAAFWLSPFQKVVYTTAQYRGTLGPNMECFPTAAYWHIMTDKWSASAEQLHEMRAQGCKRWALERKYCGQMFSLGLVRIISRHCGLFVVPN